MAIHKPQFSYANTPQITPPSPATIPTSQPCFRLLNCDAWKQVTRHTQGNLEVSRAGPFLGSIYHAFCPSCIVPDACFVTVPNCPKLTTPRHPFGTCLCSACRVASCRPFAAPRIGRSPCALIRSSARPSSPPPVPRPSRHRRVLPRVQPHTSR